MSFGTDAKGVYAIATTPFLPDGSLDTPSIDRLTDFYQDSGVTGMTILGIMGEAPKLEPAESRAILDNVYKTLGLKEPPGANLLLVAIEQDVQQAVASFSMTNPAASAPALARGLTATRAALAKLSGDVEVAHVLRLKERQFVDALTTALGVTVSGLAANDGTRA